MSDTRFTDHAPEGYNPRHTTFLEDTLQRKAAKLRDLADRIDMMKVRPNYRDKLLDHTAYVQEILNDVSWGIANLNLQASLADAADADRVVRADPKQS